MCVIVPKSIGENFTDLAKLDIDGNKKLENAEINVWQKLSQLSQPGNPPPTLAQINAWYTALPVNEQNFAQTLLPKLSNNAINFRDNSFHTDCDSEERVK